MTELTFQDLFPKPLEPPIRFTFKQWSDEELVRTNIDPKEYAKFKEYQLSNPLNDICWKMALAEEERIIEERRLFIRHCIKGVLEEQGKHPSDELLDDATSLAISRCILPCCNPSRKGWFIEMLCCFCDGKPYERNGQKIELKYKEQ